MIGLPVETDADVFGAPTSNLWVTKVEIRASFTHDIFLLCSVELLKSKTIMYEYEL